jgi:hypothetical protein
MSQKQYMTALHRQLDRLNAIIDRKIMLGRNYKVEARQHRQLLMKLRSHRNPSMLDRISSLFRQEYA